MTTPKKESGPPPRPPAPRSMARRSASNNSIKKSFKLLEEDEEDEEDLTILTGEFDKKLDKKLDKQRETTPVKTSKAIQDEAKLSANLRSKSLDDDRTTMNVARIKQNFVDISSGLKDKITKKIEEIAAEINSTESEVERNESVPSDTSKDQEEVNKTEIKVSGTEDSKSALDTVDSSQKSTPVKSKPPGTTSSPPARLPPTPEEISQIELENAAFAIVEDFYSNEPKEDFTGMPVLPQSASSGELRQRSSLRKLIRSKTPKPSTAPASPVSMSKLMTKKEEEESKEDEDVFYSPGNKSKKSQNAGDTSPAASMATEAKPVSGVVKDMMAVPVKNLILMSGFLFLYMILPLPSYISGMLMGILLTSAGWSLYLFIIKPPPPKPVPEKVPFNKLPPMVLPEMKDIVTEDGVFRGWMNEITGYTPERYHINQTHSVYMDLEGTTLRIRRPKTNIPKRAMWDEGQIQTPQFIHQRHLNLEGSRVYLLPPGLVKKRIWSKKYPICIALANLNAPVTVTKEGNTPDSDSGFEIVTEQKCSDSVLYLFARTCREKEDWYKRFTAAAKGQPLPSHLGQIRKCFSTRAKQQSHQNGSSSVDSVTQHKRHESTDSTSSNGSSSPTRESEDSLIHNDIESFIRYMGRLMPRELYDSHSTSPTHKQAHWDYRGPVDCDDGIIWLNALISRLFWDFLSQNYFKEKILDKLQRKLSKIHIPYFIEELKVTNIDLGDEMPLLRRGNRPYFDEQGFWVDADLNYDGGFQMTIETKINLMRLKHTDKPESESNSRRSSAITNSDEEDSAESSSDEEEDSAVPNVEEGGSGGRPSRKILRYLGKITQSKYFQSATEIKYIKKKMEEVSNTPLVLTVEVRMLSGTLTINIPPPPTDRLWYGFRGNPKLQLVAKPKVGAREVTVTHITEWIEKKLSTEFQRVLVMPNMDDLVIPILMCDHIQDAVPLMPSSPSGSEV